MRRGHRAAFLLALEFLTVVRPRRTVDVQPPTVGLSVLWFPAVGFLIGLTLAGVDSTAAQLLPSGVAAALVLVAAALITGSLHLDGLADTADGLFGGHTPERRLEIMKDSRTGTFGAVAVALALLLTYAGLSAMPDTARRVGLITAPVAARLAAVLAIVAFPYARPSGLGRLYRDHAPRFAVLVAAAPVVFVLGAIGPASLLALPLGLAAGWLIARFADRRLGGLTGDVYGAVIVCVEVLVLVVMSGVAAHDRTRGWVVW